MITLMAKITNNQRICQAQMTDNQPDQSSSVHLRLAHARKHFGLSQRGLADKLGISVRSYQNYEQGEREVQSSVICALWQRLEVQPVWLLTGEGAMLGELEPTQRLDQTLLDEVVDAVERFEEQLGKRLLARHKARLVGLLYEKSQLLTEVTGEKFDETSIRSLLKLVA